MEYLRNWAMTICGVIVLSAVCETIVPKGEMKKYVRLVLGIIISLTVLMPLERFLSEGELADFQFDFSVQSSAFAELSDMEEKQQKQVIALYKQKIADKLYQSLNGSYSISEVSVDVAVDDEHFGEITRVLIAIDGGVNEKDICDIKKTVEITCGASGEITEVAE